VQETEYAAIPSSAKRRHNVVFPEPDGPETTSKIPFLCDMRGGWAENSKYEIQNSVFTEDP
jgi:hypothetical protein